MYEILQAGGLTSGGFNFDTKLRRQSMSRDDLFPGHIGGIDPLAYSLRVAAKLVEDGALGAAKDARYAGWDTNLGAAITDGTADLASLEAQVVAGAIDPSPVSGRQEQLENLINRTIWSVS